MLIPVLLAMALFAEPAASGAGAAAGSDAAAEAKPAAAEAKPEMRRVCEKVAVENSRAPKKKCRMVPAHSPDAPAE